LAEIGESDLQARGEASIGELACGEYGKPESSVNVSVVENIKSCVGHNINA
jgi:hypothetical protein